MVSNRWFALAICSLLVAANLQTSGCSKSSSTPNDLAITWESEPAPPRVGSNLFTLTLSAKNGERLSGARVSIEGDMSHAGMSPVFGEATEMAPGRYQGKLDLDMRGDWIVLFHVQLIGGRTLSRQIRIQAT
jgi:hypothetical protein